MERDALIGHGIMDFVQDTYLKRSDGTVITVCDGCGTQPIYNESRKIQICPLCDGPVKFTGNKEIVAPVKRSMVTFSKIQVPYAFQLVNDEIQTYMNIGMRYITGKNANVLRLPEGMSEPDREKAMARAGQPIPTFVPEFEEESAVETSKTPTPVAETVIDVVTKGTPSVTQGPESAAASATATAVAALIDGIRQNTGTRFASAAPAPQITQQQVGVVPLGPAVNMLSATPEEGVGEFEELAPLPRSRPAVSFAASPQQSQQQTQQLLPSQPNVAPTGQMQQQVTLPGALQGLQLQQGGQFMQPMTLQTVTQMPSVQVFNPSMAQVPPTIVVDGMDGFAPPEQTGGRRSRAQSPAPQQPRSFSSSNNGQREQVTSATRITIQKLG
jgi:hypothetical protein